MNTDDLIYVCCLLLCIFMGYIIRRIYNDWMRKWYCTILGIFIVVVVSGLHSAHCFLSVFLGSLAIVYVPPSYCHLVTFVVMFGYLVFFRLLHYIGLPSPPGHTNMVQMLLTLKVAGVAFEKTAAWKRIQRRSLQIIEHNSGTGDNILELNPCDAELQFVGPVELLHYSFNYIGLLTGPYYRYRTYRDYFETPFKDYAPCIPATLEKLKNAGFYCILYLSASYLWPLDYALSDEFYTERSFFYRLMYVWPTFFIFRMRMYTGLTLSECVCTMAGFGAYPDIAEVNNGEGPRDNYLHLRDNAHQLTYNFKTIVNTRVKDVETCWTFREGMKHWNICVQYWLAVNVYKLFPSRKYRTAVTLLCSAFWHGFRPGHYFCIMGAPIYVPLEDMWNNLIRKDLEGTNRKIVDVIFWIAKFFAFSYLGTAFLLVSFENIWKFYSSVYHFGYIAWAVLLVSGFILSKLKRKHRSKIPNTKATPLTGNENAVGRTTDTETERSGINANIRDTASTSTGETTSTKPKQQ